MRLRGMRATARLPVDHTLSACAAFSSLAVQRKPGTNDMVSQTKTPTRMGWRFCLTLSLVATRPYRAYVDPWRTGSFQPGRTKWQVYPLGLRSR